MPQCTCLQSQYVAYMYDRLDSQARVYALNCLPLERPE